MNLSLSYNIFTWWNYDGLAQKVRDPIFNPSSPFVSSCQNFNSSNTYKEKHCMYMQLN
jgi:hypothetical protein